MEVGDHGPNGKLAQKLATQAEYNFEVEGVIHHGPSLVVDIVEELSRKAENVTRT